MSGGGQSMGEEEDNNDDESEEVEDEDDNYREPEVTECKRCGGEGIIDDMVDCPKFFEDAEEFGAFPGWLHKNCCEEEFVDNPRECLEACMDQEYASYIEKHFKECVDVENLVEKKSSNDFPFFANENNTLLITAQADKLFQQYRPLNVVIDTISDEEEDRFYVKDNQKNITLYSLTLVKDIESRLSSFNALEPEKFCIPKGPYCIMYQVGDLSIGAALAPRREEVDMQEFGADLARRSREKSSDAENFFGVNTGPNRENLKERIQSFSEPELINVVLVPVLYAQGFIGVKPVSFHGPGESGADFHPFYKVDEFGKIVYYSAQAKAVKIHANTAVEEGNVNQLINQIQELFRATFKSFSDNTEKKITRAFVFSSKEITPEARDQLFFACGNSQSISVIEIDDIVTAVTEKGLADEVLSHRAKKDAP